ncbi:MAG: CPBP family intramembrane glutamic endopeptidase [Fusicatenibacter sp.]|nr:CPBP family intramembrane metalloprotease [Lachnospiraceae bacterium]MDY2937146.1 CPBP family intramembrane glutamic endopeptidase [Fusicatenibacter sp.]
MLVLSIFLLLWYLLDLRGRKETTRLYPASLLDTGEILVLGIFWQYAADMILLLLSEICPVWYQNYMEKLSSGGMSEITFGAFLLSVIFAPVFEELLYRGVLFRKLMDYLPFGLCNIVQAAFFGMAHKNLIQGMIAFLLGLLLGWMAKYYRSIFPSVFLHIVINLFGWMNYALQLGEFQKGIIAAASGAVIVAMCRKRIREKKNGSECS